MVVIYTLIRSGGRSIRGEISAHVARLDGGTVGKISGAVCGLIGSEGGKILRPVTLFLGGNYAILKGKGDKK